MTMPTCGHKPCTQRASVVYRSTSAHPVPRCWDHAPSFPAAIALGWIDPPGNENHAADTLTP